MPKHRNTQPAAKDSNSQLTNDSRNELVYQFTPDCPIHVEMDEENPWFLADDITRALGYPRARDIVRYLDADEKKMMRYLSPSGVIKQHRNMSFVNESGLYHLIFMSEKPEAVKFRRWVTSVVLPEIRRTGGYFGALSELALYEHEGQEMYKYADVLNELGYKKGGSVYKLQERYPKEFDTMNGVVMVSKTYATVMTCRRKANSILKGIKARQLELPFGKEVSHD